MAALDGIPFHVFCSSEDIRLGIVARGFSDIPKSSNTFRAKIIQYDKVIREEMTKEFELLKKNGERFSLSFDEWSSMRNRRYFNLNVHLLNKIYNLGLTRIKGSSTSVKCVEEIEKKLECYKLDM